MSFYPLEALRAAHEDIERCERLAALALREREMQQLRARAKKQNSRVWDGTQMLDLHSSEAPLDPTRELFAAPNQQHNDHELPVAGPSSTSASLILTQRDGEEITRRLLDMAAEKNTFLAALYQDSSLTNEIDKLSGNADNEEIISTFYARLRTVKDAYRATEDDDQQTAAAIGSGADRALILSIAQASRFTGEEAFGKYVDLHELHQKFNAINTGCDPIDYVTYLSKVDNFEQIPPKVSRQPQYKQYCIALLAYLTAFARRVTPLRVFDVELADVSQRVLKEKRDGCRNIVDTSDFHSPDQINRAVTPEKLKEALLFLGLKCSGRPAERSERLFQAVGPENECSSKIFEIAILQRKIKFLCDEIVPDQLQASKLNAEKKLTLSFAELEAERLAEQDPVLAAGESMHDNGDSDEEKPIYNPKDVPLGWDGKPIPYWQYKLHGLNHTFKCEVCGNATYRGPRAFERHFAESRHTYGLRCLGITYTKQYFMVSKISEVQALQSKLALQLKGDFVPEEDAEFEDANGNVFNSKTYGDLARQGLL